MPSAYKCYSGKIWYEIAKTRRTLETKNEDPLSIFLKVKRYQKSLGNKAREEKDKVEEASLLIKGY